MVIVLSLSLNIFRIQYVESKSSSNQIEWDPFVNNNVLFYRVKAPIQKVVSRYGGNKIDQVSYLKGQVLFLIVEELLFNKCFHNSVPIILIESLS
jgi:hypothetical protein